LLIKKNIEDYRKGAVGAMMDEYERAALELKSIVENVSEEDYSRIADAETTDEDCRSIQTVMAHVVLCGYAYANDIRSKSSMPFENYKKRQISKAEIGGEIDAMLVYTAETLDGKWEMSDDEIVNFVTASGENFTENLEQLLEHAIVHILRHRRQIEKFLLKFEH